MPQNLDLNLSEQQKEFLKFYGNWTYTSMVRAKGAPITVNIPKAPMPTFVFNPTKEFEILSKKISNYRSIDAPFIPSVEQL